MDGIELLYEIKNNNNIKKILDNNIKENNKNVIQSKYGNIIEKIWDIIIKFGFCDILQNNIHDHYYGNINTGKIKKIENIENYLNKLKIFSKGKGGSSDITLYNKISNKWIFISSKYYLNDMKKSIKDYDIQDILAVIKENNYKFENYEIYLLVNDKNNVLNIIKNSHETNNYITSNIHNIMDFKDLEKYFNNFIKFLENKDINHINKFFDITKIPLLLRFHQELIVYKIIKQIKQNEKTFLIGAKPRSGKTYCIGGLFIEYYKEYNNLNALIITPVPNETISQFVDDLFYNFIDFKTINIVEIKNSKMLNNIELKKNNIIIISKQLLDNYIDDFIIESIKNINLNFIIFDENHFHGTTTLSKNIIDNYSNTNTIKVYLTATFNKPLKEWSIKNDNQFYWDIEDEQFCKNRDINSLIDKHGKEVLLFLNNNNINDKLSIYDKMPKLEILTNMMYVEKFKIIKERIKDSCYGFSNSTLLCGNYPNEVDMILRYITGSDKEIDYPDKDISIFNRIKEKCINENSRTLLNNNDFTSQLWFLPYGINMKIKNVSEHLKERMEQNSVLSLYDIKIINYDKLYRCKDVKDDIQKWELKAKKNGKNGLIILAGNQLTLGITLPFVDIVFLFNDILSCDLIVQMMYRSMTEYNDFHNEINKKPKKFGFVVDMNISRTLNIMNDFKIYKKNLNGEKKFRYIVENNLMNIDSDIFYTKEQKEELIKNLSSLWINNPINNLEYSINKIKDIIIKLELNDQNLLNKYFSKKNKECKKLNFSINENNTILKNGKNIIKIYNDKTNVESEKDEKNIIDNISLTKDILSLIIPLVSIISIDVDIYELNLILDYIDNNPILFEIFESQINIWWNNKLNTKKIINLLQNLYFKYFYDCGDFDKNNSLLYNIITQLKMFIKSSLDDKENLIEFIHNNLKPLQNEKQQYGEVFTHLDIIKDLFDNLDKNYIEKNNKSIFEEKNFRWGDITGAGIGNFSIILYYRLMEGLKKKIPNENKRKKHIIENMIYMAEINKKNIFILNKIFESNKYKLNLFHGDALFLDINKEWGIDNFDVIVGNPPYNKGGIKSSSGKYLGEKNETIWPRFVSKSLNILKENGYLVFIHPLSWLKKSHSIHDLLLDKYIIYLKLWDDIKSLSMINGNIPISLYILQNIKNIDKNKTLIISEMKNTNTITTSKVYLNKSYSIPLAYNKIFNKLIKFIEKNDCKLDVNTKTVKSIGIKEPLPNKYSIHDNLGVDTYTIKEGIMVKKLIQTHPDMSKEKLIISNKRGFNGAFIDKGKLGLTGTDKFYILGDDLELIKKILSFKICKIITQYTKYRQSFLNSEAFTYIPDLRKMGYTDIEEDKFYELVGLNITEINEIKKEYNKTLKLKKQINNKTIKKR